MAPKKKTAASTAASSSSKQKKQVAAPEPAHSSSGKPTYLDMIKEAISKAMDNGEKQGISRQAIKQFMQDEYDVDPEAANTKTALKKALEKGIEAGEFILPHGISGKIKLAPKSVSKKRKAEQHEDDDEGDDSEQENHKPAAAPSVARAGLGPDMLSRFSSARA
ncbi:hypothetical protein CF327_g3504 [Tilletia walkeri]|nr:hypothetical protein CF327_g3504 [Tilletia walkeri]